MSIKTSIPPLLLSLHMNRHIRRKNSLIAFLPPSTLLLHPQAIPKPHPRSPRPITATMPPSDLYSKYGPWAVITGASSGLGVEFAHQLAVQGLSIVLVARRTHRLEALAQKLRTTCNVDTRVVTADLTIRADISRVISECAHLQIGLLINNAGVETHGSFFKADEDDLLQIVDVNVTAVMLLARAFGHKMCERNRGGILFVSSILSPGMPWLSTYSASKSFVTCLALTLREELSRSNVHCMALEPGLVATEMTVKDEDVETANNSASNKWLMGTEECVSEALRVFGKEACFTPGLMNRIVKHCFLLLPRTVSLWLMSGYMLRVVDHKELNI